MIYNDYKPDFNHKPDFNQVFLTYIVSYVVSTIILSITILSALKKS